MLCTQCGKWRHERCSKLRTLNVGSGHTRELPLCLDGKQIEVVNHFCYLGDALSGEGGVEHIPTPSLTREAYMP